MKASEYKKSKEWNDTQERKDLAVLTGIYYSEMYSGDDTLRSVQKIVKFADKYDFELIEQYGDIVIDTDKAREDAYKFAKSLATASNHTKVKGLVERYIDKMFYDIQSEYEIEDGDIGIERTFELDELEDKLADLVQDYLRERCGD